MKRLLELFVVSLYLIQFSLFLAVWLSFDFENYFFLGIPLIFVLVSVILAVLNIGNAVYFTRKMVANPSIIKSTGRTVLKIKLLAVPFYVLNFLLWTTLSGLFIVMPGNVFFIFIAIPAGIGFAYLAMLASSSYSIGLLFALKKNKKISFVKFVFVAICLLVFVADILGQMIVMRFAAKADLFHKG